MTETLFDYRLIPLTQGKFAIVDAEDYESLIQRNWYLNTSSTIEYACRCEKENGKYHHIYMHRQILNAKPNEEIDHKSRNGLDNRKCNIRICSHAQNNFNKKKNKPNGKATSKYKGVHRSKGRNKWAAQINHKHIGRFDKEIDAAKAYDKAAKEQYGEYARLNFGD